MLSVSRRFHTCSPCVRAYCHAASALKVLLLLLYNALGLPMLMFKVPLDPAATEKLRGLVGWNFQSEALVLALPQLLTQVLPTQVQHNGHQDIQVSVPSGTSRVLSVWPRLSHATVVLLGLKQPQITCYKAK